jgi:heptosyltransferase-2
MGILRIKFIDKLFGLPYCIILGIIKLFSRKKIPPKDKTRNILIIQLWGIGETILTVPAIKSLKQRYKNTAIDVLCTQRNKDVYFGYSFISKLNVIKPSLISIKWFVIKNLRKYDIVIDMEEYLNISAIMAFYLGNCTMGYSHGARSLVYTKKVDYNDQQHTSKTFFDLVKALGVKGSVKRLEKLNYTGTDKKIVNLTLKYSKISKKSFIVGIAPGAAESSKSRMWPKQNFAKLIEKIGSKKENVKVILIGAAYEKALNESIINSIQSKRMQNNTINLAGKLTLRQTFYLISKCNVFIGNDSGPMHIAAAMNVKTIGLFGPNLPKRFAPLNKKSKSIYKKMPCSPCINVHKAQVPECFYSETSKDYQKCMKEIKVKDVLKYI